MVLSVRTRSSGAVLAAGLATGFVADQMLADPERGHPVAVFGRAAGRVEGALYADSRARGAIHTALCVGSAAAVGTAVSRRDTPPLATYLATAAATWCVLGAASLRREAASIGDLLESGDLEAARERLPRLCGRDHRNLPEREVARAVVESVAENTSDAVVAPLFWGAVAGVPGLLAYRAANTLDAMVGHKSERYLKFGWSAARLDDAMNLVPARLTGMLTVAMAPKVGGSRQEAWRALRFDGAKHPSPNAGRCEAAAAGALGLRLGGTNSYASRIEHRPYMGVGRTPRGFDIARANRLSAAVSGGAAGVLVGGALASRLLMSAVARRRHRG
jgi:adenosylcobinamide-phosphate synthase